MVKVPPEIIERFGVVSRETAEAMSAGIMNLSESDYSVGITGLAGPASESDILPVGTVYVSVKSREKTVTQNLKLYELGQFERNINRLLAVGFALEMLEELMKEEA